MTSVRAGVDDRGDFHDVAPFQFLEEVPLAIDIDDILIVFDRESLDRASVGRGHAKFPGHRKDVGDGPRDGLRAPDLNPLLWADSA